MKTRVLLRRLDSLSETPAVYLELCQTHTGSF